MGAYKFEQAKLKRLLSTYGIEYHFERLEKNEFGEPSVPRTPSKTVDVVGMYHEQSQVVQMSTSNGTRYRTEKRPLILAEYDVASKLVVDDRLVHNGVEYKVVGVRNINDIGVYGDISLEVIDDGGSL